MKKGIIILIISLTPILLAAQLDDYYSGYYIDNKGNKIEGLINISNKRTIKFLEDSTSGYQLIKLSIIKELNLEGKSFKVLQKISLKPEISLTPIKYKYVLAEKLVEGKIRIYKISSLMFTGTDFLKSQKRNYVMNDSTKVEEMKPTSEDVEDYFLLEKNQNEKLIQVRTGNKKFRQLLTNLTNDNKEAFKKINIQTKNYYNLFEIVEIYNSN